MNLRVFLGIFPKEDALSYFQAQQEKFREVLARQGIEARWQSPAQWHMTLLFLGSTPEEEVQSLIERLQSQTWKRPCHQTFDLGLVFPGVLTLGGSETAPELKALQEKLVLLCPSADKKQFRPHVTLARLEKRNLSSVLKEVKVETHAVRIGSFQLVQSHTEAKGSRYEILESFPLLE